VSCYIREEKRAKKNWLTRSWPD